MGRSKIRTMQLTIRNPVAAPRMTQRDRYKKRPVVMRYWAWRDRIYQAWCELPAKERVAFTKPVIMGFKFYVVGYPAVDLGNLIKGVEDAFVKHGIIPGDTIKHIPKYDNPEAFFLCDKCSFKPAKQCPGVRKCNDGFAIITINEIK